MIHAPEHHVYFAVIDFGDDPGVVTAMMGMPPTRAWVGGEPRGDGGRQTHSRWALQSRLPLSSAIDLHVDDVLSQLQGRQAAVRDVLGRFPAHLAIAAYWDAFNPSFQLSSTIIQSVAEFGLLIDFDLYYLKP
ncbi:MAG: DUF4279 domain-containing protein [Tepidisphaeraceae bacterium]